MWRAFRNGLPWKSSPFQLPWDTECKHLHTHTLTFQHLYMCVRVDRLFSWTCIFAFACLLSVSCRHSFLLLLTEAGLWSLQPLCFTGYANNGGQCCQSLNYTGSRPCMLYFILQYIISITPAPLSWNLFLMQIICISVHGSQLLDQSDCVFALNIWRFSVLWTW